MMKFIVAACATILASLAGAAHAQSIDVSHSRTIAVNAKQAKAQPPKAPAEMGHLMTRAVAIRKADGTQVVKCHVEQRPTAGGKAPHTSNRKGSQP